MRQTHDKNIEKADAYAYVFGLARLGASGDPGKTVRPSAHPVLL
jgi:hypothetical protein